MTTSSFFNKNHLILLLIFAFHLGFLIYLRQILFPVHLTAQNFLLFDLIGKHSNLSYTALILLDLSSLVLIYLIGKRSLGNPFSLILTSVYGISPWIVYLTSTESFYIYLLFLVLLGVYGLVLIKSNFKLLGSVLFGVSLIFSFYSSSLLLLILPVVAVLSVLLKIEPFNKLRALYITILILSLPLFFVIFKNHSGFKNIVSREVKLFNDPGLINNVNKYQGSAREVGFVKLAKVSENKYLFSLEFVFLKFSKQFVPSTYFTFDQKLLNFSFTPPICFGFIIPFLYGIYVILQLPKIRRLLFISNFLAIPSVVSKQVVDLNRLILFAPVVFFIIAYGLLLLVNGRKNKLSYIFLVSTFVLVIFQMLLTFNDIGSRERARYLRYFGANAEIKE